MKTECSFPLAFDSQVQMHRMEDPGRQASPNPHNAFPHTSRGGSQLSSPWSEFGLNTNLTRVQESSSSVDVNDSQLIVNRAGSEGRKDRSEG